jgi:hypothetical protein
MVTILRLALITVLCPPAPAVVVVVDAADVVFAFSDTSAAKLLFEIFLILHKDLIS